MVLFSRSSKTIVLLELTVPLEDNVHLAHDRKTTKYSASVTACEENGFLRRTCSLWKLDVLAIALTPSSIASKPSACQSRQRVRSDPKRQKPPFAHRMYSFFAEACRLGSVKLFFTVPCSRRDRFVFFCLHLLCQFPFPTVRTLRQLVPFPSIHTTPPRFSNSSTVRRCRPSSQSSAPLISVFVGHVAALWA